MTWVSQQGVVNINTWPPPIPSCMQCVISRAVLLDSCIESGTSDQQRLPMGSGMVRSDR
jgi:hypothetical protein